MAGTLPVPDKPRVTIPDKSRNSGPHCHRPDPNANLPFLKDDTYTDVILNVEGKKLYINRSLLGYASPYFHKVLGNGQNGGSPERKGGKTEIKIVDKSYQDFVDLLSYLHPAVGKDLTEKTALRLLPIADEYEMLALKSSCEEVLLNILKSNSWEEQPPKRGQPSRKFESGRLLNCLLASDRGKSYVLLDQCVKIYTNPEVSVKDVKSCTELTDQVKAKIYESRMDAASSKLHKVSSELEKERQQNEQLKNNTNDNSNRNVKNKGRSEGRSERVGPSSRQPPKPTPSNETPTKARQYGTRQRYDDSIKGSTQDLSRNSRNSRTTRTK